MDFYHLMGDDVMFQALYLNMAEEDYIVLKYLKMNTFFNIFFALSLI